MGAVFIEQKNKKKRNPQMGVGLVEQRKEEKKK